MKTYIVARHRVKDEETLEEYRYGVAMLSRATGFAKSELRFGLKLSIDATMSASLRRETLKITNAIPPEIYLIMDPERRGPGMSFRQVAFNPGFAGSIIICVDLDQFVLDTQNAIDRLLSFASRIADEDILFGCGARNWPVRLAKYDRNSELRIIHELFHSMAAQSHVVDVPTPAYAAFGESTPGCYFLNTMHEEYPTLLAAVAHAAQQADLHAYAAEYYCVIKASQLGKCTAALVEAKENPIMENRNEQEELHFVASLITESTAALAHTDVGERLHAVLLDEHNISRIAEFYPEAEVRLVRQMMLSCFALSEIVR